MAGACECSRVATSCESRPRDTRVSDAPMECSEGRVPCEGLARVGVGHDTRLRKGLAKPKKVTRTKKRHS